MLGEASALSARQQTSRAARGLALVTGKQVMCRVSSEVPVAARLAYHSSAPAAKRLTVAIRGRSCGAQRVAVLPAAVPAGSRGGRCALPCVLASFSAVLKSVFGSCSCMYDCRVPAQAVSAPPKQTTLRDACGLGSAASCCAGMVVTCLCAG